MDEQNALFLSLRSVWELTDERRRGGDDAAGWFEPGELENACTTLLRLWKGAASYDMMAQTVEVMANGSRNRKPFIFIYAFAF